MIETINKLVRTNRQMLHEIGREPTPGELADKLSMPLAVSDHINPSWIFGGNAKYLKIWPESTHASHSYKPKCHLAKSDSFDQDTPRAIATREGQDAAVALQHRIETLMDQRPDLSCRAHHVSVGEPVAVHRPNRAAKAKKGEFSR